MPDRSIRVSEDIWKRSKAAAALLGESLSGFTEAALESRLRGGVEVNRATVAAGKRKVEAVEWPILDVVLPREGEESE